jgi:PIN domain nuclease of toxin-antitoxin system
VILLDASALIAFLLALPEGEQVRKLLDREPAMVTTVALAETFDVLARHFAIAEEETRAALAPVLGERVHVMALDEERAIRAGGIRATHYRRRSCPISLADSVLLASAGPDDTVVTSDRAVLAVAKRERLESITIRG